MNKTENKLMPELRFPEFKNDEGWEEKKISCIGEVITGNTPKKEDKENWGGNFVWITAQDFRNKYIYTSAYKLTPKGKNRARIIPKNSVLVTCIASIGLNGINKVECATNQQINALICNKSNFYEFIYYSISYNDKRLKSLAGQTAVPIINKSVFEKFTIPIPTSTLEQQKIADCLSSLDEAISVHSDKLETLKNHKKGLLQNLFPQESETVPKYRFPEFKNDGNWEEINIQELINKKWIVSHLDGNHGALYPRADEFSNSGIPYITANDFISGIIDFSKCKYLPIEKAELFKKGIAKDQDILFAHNATVGPVAKLLTSFPYVILSTTATYYRCDNKNLINDFLLFAFETSSFVKQYSRVMSQSTRNQVPITTQRTFHILLPKPKEQQKIAECLSEADSLITAQADKIEQLKAHKKGLMQQLFPQLKA
ncbi:restriction endonuclease subunit S [Elizabethkingia anophelis]|nr:restriction endonuclease subunit S [Elizabethkingia anophelis]